jgi:hypothetical protein
MNKPTLHRCPHGVVMPRRQRGIVMLYGLIALAIMLIGAMAMVRSMNTSLFNAGNLGFKRDLTNQGERAVSTVMTLMQTGALGTESTRQSNAPTRNYSATILATNAQGLPNALVSDTAFAAVAAAGNDIAVSDLGVTLRYVVDRLCVNSGAADTSHCTMSDGLTPTGGSASELVRAEDTTSGGLGAVPQQVVYRLSIRVSGPRSTQAFFQTTFTL